ncbi:MAG TPA: hypothetical protein PKW61_00035 [Tenuifilaceae bacterium]|nr:hypothetical protein [Tenuifilaceae bacterium]
MQTTIYDLKDYFQSYLIKNNVVDMLFEEADKNEIAYLSHRLLIAPWDKHNRTFIFHDVFDLTPTQQKFLDKVGKKFNLIQGRMKNVTVHGERTNVYYLTHPVDIASILKESTRINRKE